MNTRTSPHALKLRSTPTGIEQLCPDCGEWWPTEVQFWAQFGRAQCAACCTKAVEKALQAHDWVYDLLGATCSKCGRFWAGDGLYISPGQRRLEDEAGPCIRREDCDRNAAPPEPARLPESAFAASVDRQLDKRKHAHYFNPTPFEAVDIYRVLLLFGVTDPCLQHAAKKLLVAGGRGGGKDIGCDIQEAIDTLLRWQEMRAEEAYAAGEPCA